MDIKQPVPLWIMARLYNEEHPVSLDDLARKLCQQSFESMVGDNDFNEAIQKLAEAKYIEYGERTFSVPSVLAAADRHVTYHGYWITVDGIIAFRRQMGVPVEKIL